MSAQPSSPPASDLAAARERQNDDARVITVDGKRYMHFNGVWSKERDDGWYIIAEKVPAFDRIVELEDETVRMRAEIDRLGDGDDSARDAAVTRFEVIDHRPGFEGRSYVAYRCHVERSYQDDGRTLKVFVTDAARTAPGGASNG